MSPDTVDPAKRSWRQVIATTARLLTFRATERELSTVSLKHLIFGLVCTWIVGIGRYWDNPRVTLLQHLGIGSVIYIFALALLLWLVVWPLRPRHWSYFRVVTFVSLVSPPAILYAIPVEKMFTLQTANDTNVLLLAVVALWRVALLVYLLRVVAKLDFSSLLVATLLPLAFIVFGLSTLNLEKAVFSIMGGLKERTPNDNAFVAVQILSLLSMLLFVPLLIFYLVLVIQKRPLKKSHG